MTKIKIGINGFGRIGRTFFRQAVDHQNIEVIAINDLAPINTMVHLLKYDSVHGVFPLPINHNKDHLIVNGHKIRYSQCKSPEEINWDDVDFVLESSGKFKTKQLALLHKRPHLKKIIISVPPADDLIPMVVMGVNHQELDLDELVISNASCTTNNTAPMLQLIDQHCKIQSAYITTVHSYTTDQSLHDQPHHDLRRSRAAGQSIVPTTTGAAKALTKIFPELQNKIGGSGIRVPVINGSLTDLTCYVEKPMTIEEINQLFYKASQNQYKGILSYTQDPIVSVDIVGNPYSCVFDAGLTSVIDNMIKVIGWYDNEVGYSNRLIDLILYLKSKFQTIIHTVT